MTKSSERFKNRLLALINSGIIKKIDLHRKTGLARNSIDGYLENAVPDLDALDKIADALGTPSWDLIKPEDQPLSIPHSLEDCFEAVGKAALGKPVLVKTSEGSDIIPSEFLEKFNQIPGSKRKVYLKQWDNDMDTFLGSSKKHSQTKKESS